MKEIEIIDFKPSEILKPFIKTYRLIESRAELLNNVLPNTSISIAFRLKGKNAYSTGTGRLELPEMSVAGLRKTARQISYVKDTSTLIILFKECGASAFFKQPLNQLFEDTIALENIIQNQELKSVEESLAATENNFQRVAIVESFLLSKLKGGVTDQLVSTAIDKINSANGMTKIKDLVNTLFISNDVFEKRFRKVVGATPKQFSDIVRMSSIVRQKSPDRLIDIAFDAGFYDQSHFNKEFKNFTGQIPTDFYKSPGFW